MIVADVVPNPLRTVFLRRTEEHGCRARDGPDMLVNQGVRGMEL